MDPNLLLKLTDPAIQKDPQAMRQLADEVRQESRRAVLRSVRLNGLVMTMLGAALLAVGLACGALAIASTGSAGPGATPYPFIALLAGGIGALFVVLGRVFSVPGPIRNGVPGTATVTAVRSIGRTIGVRKPGVTATLTKINLTLSVQPPSGAAFQAPYSELVISSDIGRLQVGATVPIGVHPQKPRRFAIDWS